MEGTIAGAGFGPGHRIVIGVWDKSPVGAMADVMWAKPDGTRVLLAPSAAVARFVGGIYSFDDVMVVDFQVESGPGRVRVRAGDLDVELRGGRPLKVFKLRPRFLRHRAWWVRLEDLVLRPVIGRLALRGAAGVRAYGVSPSGVKEWYCVDEYRPVVSGAARFQGRDLGSLGSLDPPALFGFSEFPARPALVRCAPLLEGAERFISTSRL